MIGTISGGASITGSGVVSITGSGGDSITGSGSGSGSEITLLVFGSPIRSSTSCITPGASLLPRYLKYFVSSSTTSSNDLAFKGIFFLIIPLSRTSTYVGISVNEIVVPGTIKVTPYSQQIIFDKLYSVILSVSCLVSTRVQIHAILCYEQKGLRLTTIACS